MTRKRASLELRDWLLFAAAAIVPAIVVGALGLRALGNEEAAQRRARAEDLRGQATSVRNSLASELEQATALLDDATATSADRGASEEDVARATYGRLSARTLYGLDPMILAADGRVLQPPSMESPAPVRKADDACSALVTSGDKAKLLASCEEVVTTTGRHLWLSLALEALMESPVDPELVGRMQRWIAAHGADLRDSERLGAIDELDRLRGVAPEVRRELIAAFQAASSDADELASVLRSDAGIRALRSARGTQRFSAKSGLGVVRPIGRGMVAALVMTPSSVARALAWRRSEALGSDVTATAVTSAANVDPDREAVAWLSDGIGVRVAIKDPSRDAARTDTRKVVLAAAAVVGALVAAGLATLLFARMRAARRTSELRTTFVAAVSHELRTPIASVRMLAELLEEGRVEPDEVKEVHEALAKEAKRLGETVDRLLGFSRLAAGKITLERRVQSVAAPTQRAIDAFRERRPGAEVEVALDASATSDIDAGQIEVVVTNLLENALKYAPEGKPYRVSVRRDGGSVLLSVRDTGPGIASKHHVRIFDAFERVDDRLSKATEGSGIGLSLVRQIARAHDGDAWVESEPGAGATFVVRLPEKAKV